MTERNFSKAQNVWIGKVTSVQDPDMDGRVQVRIFGHHDDQTNIPDSDLLWAKPEQDISSAGHNKIGRTPVGPVVGTIIQGYYADTDCQIPIFTSTLAKAGDSDSSGSTNNGQVTLKPGTNSSPLGGRIANNAFVTRKGQNIIKDDQTGSKGPTEQKDSDGVDVTAQAKANTKFATLPTVGSIQNPVGSILNQILHIDPKNLNAVLPQAVSAFMKIKDLNTFSCSTGVNGVLGQMLGNAMSLLGASTALNQLGGTLAPGQLSTTSTQALLVAIQALGAGQTDLSLLSDTVQSVIGQSQPAFIAALEALIQTNTLNATTLNALLALFFPQVQQNGQQSTVGSSQQNILSNLTSLIPQIAGAIQSAIDSHLPQSVLNTNLITQALQKFSQSQATLKAPSNGKKELAIKATSNPVVTPPNVSVPGTGDQASNNIMQTLTLTGDDGVSISLNADLTVGPSTPTGVGHN